jgi:excinuclease UvrABC nuclease subunit
MNINQKIAWTRGWISVVFTAYAYSTFLLPSVPGIYMLCYFDPTSTYRPLYIGQALNLKDRLARHEQWGPALQRGASAVLVAKVPGQADRDSFERLLIEEFQPPLNDQLKTDFWSSLFPS